MISPNLLLGFLGFGELLVEAIDAAVAGDETLFPGVERMAVGAGINFDFLRSGTGLERRSAGGASDDALVVLGVDAFFHFSISFRREERIASPRARK